MHWASRDQIEKKYSIQLQDSLVLRRRKMMVLVRGRRRVPPIIKKVGESILHLRRTDTTAKLDSKMKDDNT
jgi:hypothetical protein